jgi:hypothetical protein
MGQHFRPLTLVVAEPGVGVGPRRPGDGVDVGHDFGHRRLRHRLLLGDERAGRESTDEHCDENPTGGISMLGEHPMLRRSGV